MHVNAAVISCFLRKLFVTYQIKKFVKNIADLTYNVDCNFLLLFSIIVSLLCVPVEKCMIFHNEVKRLYYFVRLSGGNSKSGRVSCRVFASKLVGTPGIFAFSIVGASTSRCTPHHARDLQTILRRPVMRRWSLKPLSFVLHRKQERT